MTALLVIIIVLIVAQMTRYERRIYKATQYNKRVNDNIFEYQKQVGKIFEATKEVVISVDKKLDNIESKMNGLPYKKRARKMKVAGVEVPIEAQETKSANATEADMLTLNPKEPCRRTYYSILTPKTCPHRPDENIGSFECTLFCDNNLYKGERYDKEKNAYYVFCKAEANKEANKKITD